MYICTYQQQANKSLTQYSWKYPILLYISGGSSCVLPYTPASELRRFTFLVNLRIARRKLKFSSE